MKKILLPVTLKNVIRSKTSILECFHMIRHLFSSKWRAGSLGTSYKKSFISWLHDDADDAKKVRQLLKRQQQQHLMGVKRWLKYLLECNSLAPFKEEMKGFKNTTLITSNLQRWMCWKGAFVNIIYLARALTQKRRHGFSSNDKVYLGHFWSDLKNSKSHLSLTFRPSKVVNALIDKHFIFSV